MDKKKVFLTFNKKLEILDKIKKGHGITKLAKDYGIAKATVSNIKKNEKKIMKCATSYNIKRKCAKTGEYPLMEKQLYKWFISQRCKHVPIGGNILKEKAKKLYSEIYGTNSGFHASSGWLSGFKNRFGIRLLKVCGEKLSSNEGEVATFKEKLHKIRTELYLNDHQIYNADETGLFWKILPDKSYVASNEKTAPGRKLEKARITFLACTNASGLHKLQPLVVGKPKKPRSFKIFELPLQYRNSKNAWMTTNIFKDWFFNYFVPHVKQFLKQQGLPIRAVLILDNAPCHPKEEELKTECGSIFAIFMPPNVTPLIQPMDQNVIRLTKLQYKSNLLKMAVAKENVNEFLKHFTLKDAVYQLALAWQNIKREVIVKCWHPLLKQTSLNEQAASDDEDVPLSVLFRNEIEQKNKRLEEIHSLINIVVPGTTFTTEDLAHWTSIDENFEDDIQYTENVSEEEIEEIIRPGAPVFSEFHGWPYT